MTESFWKVLDLDPVEDRNAIRRAYAAKLKTIDPEDDPQAFIALRDALEGALDWLRWQEFRAEHEQLTFHEEAGSERAHDHPVDDGPAREIDADGAQGRIDERALEELESLLFGDDPDEFPDPDVLQALVRHILDDPAIAEVDQAERVGHWLAGIIAASIPRSDPVVSMVAEHFAWTSEARRWDRNPSIDLVVARHEGLSLLDSLLDPAHEWHDAYLELVSTEPELSYNWLLKKWPVKNLLEYIRSEVPQAEGGLNSHRVSLWEDKLYGTVGFETGMDSAKANWWWIWPGLLVLVALARLLPDKEPPPRKPPAVERPLPKAPAPPPIPADERNSIPPRPTPSVVAPLPSSPARPAIPADSSKLLYREEYAPGEKQPPPPTR